MDQEQSFIQATVPFFEGTLSIKGTEEAVFEIDYTTKKLVPSPGKGEVAKAARQFEQYRDHQRQQFDFHYIIHSSSFFKKVFEKLANIPYGHVVSYQQLAAISGSPKAARAVGQAMANNKLMIVIPCHRVIAADHSLGGFSGGLDLKRALLEHEGITL